MHRVQLRPYLSLGLAIVLPHSVLYNYAMSAYRLGILLLKTGRAVREGLFSAGMS